jgi:hypothetical protein
MEPMDPQEKRSILENAFDAEEQDVDEYERLLAERFTIDPNMPAPVQPTADAEVLGVDEESQPTRTLQEIDERLAELRTKLFPEK